MAQSESAGADVSQHVMTDAAAALKERIPN